MEFQKDACQKESMGIQKEMQYRIGINKNWFPSIQRMF